MALEQKNKVDSMHKPPTDYCCLQSKAISNPIRHKQIKKAQINKGIALKCDIHNKE
tara:strand:- start:1472 stop:1639 length:168 start_codon:yes stop_codon:yes gene_type:complete